MLALLKPAPASDHHSRVLQPGALRAGGRLHHAHPLSVRRRRSDTPTLRGASRLARRRVRHRRCEPEHSRTARAEPVDGPVRAAEDGRHHLQIAVLAGPKLRHGHHGSASQTAGQARRQLERVRPAGEQDGARPAQTHRLGRERHHDVAGEAREMVRVRDQHEAGASLLRVGGGVLHPAADEGACERKIEARRQVAARTQRLPAGDAQSVARRLSDQHQKVLGRLLSH